MANTTFDSTSKTFDNQILTFGLELSSQDSQVIVLDVALSEFADTILSSQQNTSIIQFIDTNDSAIDSTIEIPNTHNVYVNVRQNLFLSDNLFAVENAQIQTLQTATIQQVISDLDRSIVSGLAFEENNLFVQIHPNSAESTLVFGLTKLNSIIYVESAESTLAFGSVGNLNFTVPVSSVNSELTIGNISVIPLISPESVTIENSFGAPKLNYILYSNSYESGITFGVSQINMEIDDVPFPSITSTVVISNPSIKFNVNPLSIATTVNFGTASFIDNIHRLLVFKDDNISKVGENDAVVIAGGIRVNPSSAGSGTATSGNATLPSNPVGFISVNIGGTDYLMPYYNA